MSKMNFKVGQVWDFSYLAFKQTYTYTVIRVDGDDVWVNITGTNNGMVDKQSILENRRSIKGIEQFVESGNWTAKLRTHLPEELFEL